MKHKAISLFSGGLDSVLSTIIISQLNIDVTAIKFLTPFGCDMEDSSCGFDASHVAKRFGFNFKVCPMGEEYVQMVKSPTYGWGKNMNPCIDCRIMMLNWAKEILKETGAEFIITGEVLNQRPMSQTTLKLREIEQHTCLNGLILRPLSAKLLPPTIPEQKGIIDREKLYDIEGRSRNIQLNLARQFNLTNEDHGQPSGGCLLTDPSFSNRLKDFWKNSDSTSVRNIELLKIGRHFRYSRSIKIIVGRNETENSILNQMASDNETLIEFNKPAPTILIQGELTPLIKEIAIRMGLKYSKHSPTSVIIKSQEKSREEEISLLLADPMVELLHIT
ncbi:MAG: tRNA 4-thiouridine(8) synthase ThiI [Planctomycetes bacterium]|nr:tRNA 4-thiouridine(8) synthase ThiI [Planctomycetota bacterium]